MQIDPVFPLWMSDETLQPIVSMCPEVIKNRFNELKEEDYILFNASEKELGQAAKPTSTDIKIKISFWKEYDESIKTNRELRTFNICHKVCSETYFRDSFLRKKTKIAWLMCPPSDYMLELESLLIPASDKLREIMEIPLYKIDANGNKVYDLKAAELVLKTIKQVEERIKGAPVQKSENKSMHLGLEVRKELPVPNTEERIKELEEKLKDTQFGEKVIDAEFSKV